MSETQRSTAREVAHKHLRSGNPVRSKYSKIDRRGPSGAGVKLSAADSLPNKDFVLRYKVTGQKPAMALLAHTGEYSPDVHALGKGYFMLMGRKKTNG